MAGCHPRSPAARAGLKAGDRIVEIEGHPIDRAAEVKEAISRRYAGDTLRLVVLRGKERLERKVELIATLPPYPRRCWEFCRFAPPPGRTKRPARKRRSARPAFPFATSIPAARRRRRESAGAICCCRSMPSRFASVPTRSGR